ncbi:MAG: trigger factor [bacterium]|jgi:trigger factor
MKISNHKDEESKSTLTIVADQEELDLAKNKILENFQKSAKIQGFRPGKAPLNMVEKNIDPNQLQDNVLRDIVELLYGKSLEQLNIKPVSNPDINIVKFVPFSTLEFTVEVEKLGKVTLPDIKDMKVDKPKIEVSSKEIEEALQDLRLRAADFSETEKIAKLNDRVTINFDGIDPKTKKSIEGTNGTDYPLILGSRSFIPGFEEELVGLKTGDKKSFNIVFPEDYSVDSFKNRKVIFNIDVTKVEESNVPELDDKLALNFGPFKNLDELRSAIKIEMEKELTINNQRKLEDEILNFLGDKTKISLSEKLVDEELSLVESKAKQEALSQGLTWEEYLKALKMDQKSFIKQAKDTAEKRVRSGIAIGEIAQRDNIIISNEEFKQSILHLEEQYKDDAMKEEIRKPENQRDLMIRLLTDKVLKHLSAQVN